MIREFLAKLVPPGLTVIFTRGSNSTRNIVCDDLDDVESAIARNMLDGKTDVYFGLGSLKAPFVTVGDKKKVRVQDNIKGLKCFWVDIDVDEVGLGKYTSVEQAEAALRCFIADHNMPAPMVVFSGGGLHVYWPLTKSVSKDAWQPLADALKTGLLAAGVKIDRTRTADASSVLRIPGTTNIKRGTVVKIIRDCDPIKPSVMKSAILGLPGQMMATPFPRATTLPGIQGTAPEMDLGSNTAREFPPCEFDEVLRKCAQVDNLYHTGGASEPHWYAGIALARHMTDPEDAAIVMSDQHADFTKSATLAKLHSSTKERTGPTTCKRFQEFGPKGLCETCPKYGKISTPAQLGQPDPVMAVIKDSASVMQLPSEMLEAPYPYVREGGKVILCPKEGKPTTISQTDIYPTARLDDVDGESCHITWRLHIPNKGFQDITIPQSLLATPQELNKFLMGKGFTSGPSNASKVASYMSAYIHKLQESIKARKLISQLGWDANHTSFTLAPKEYHADGSFETHEVSNQLTSNMPGMTQKGTLEGWIEGMKFYNSPGHEAHQLMICGAFGSPLYHMTGHKGALVFASGVSGTGKTTVLKAMNSIWGHPQELLLNGTKNGMTANARTTKFGMYKNISMCMDEVTNWTGQQFSAMALEISQGHGKSRSTQSGALSQLLAFWSFIGFASSNSDAYDMIESAKGAAGAESMRVFQLHMTLPTSHTKAEANQYSNVTQNQNYGHAGHVFAKYIAENYDAVQTEVLSMVDKITDRIGGDSAERFWIAVLASSMVAGRIAKKLGLIDFHVGNCVKWGMSQLKVTRSRVQSGVKSPEAIVSEFLDQYNRETLVLVMRQGQGQTAKPVLDKNEPLGALYIRYEKWHQVAYITKTKIKDHCRDIGVNFTEMESLLTSRGVLIDKSAKRTLGANTSCGGGGQVGCWEIDVSKL